MKKIILLFFFFPSICLSYSIYPKFINNLDIQILRKNSYTLYYSTNHNQTLMCIYDLNKDQILSTNQVHRTNDFTEDICITNDIHITPKIYYKSGYDKGHLCPAQDRCYDINDMSETFLMSNMSPQDPSFNRGIWKKLEEYTRQCAIINTNITVITGPVIFNKHFNLDSISVPQMFYKIIIFNKYKVECYLIPNQKCNLNFDKYKVDVEYLKNLLEIKI